MTGFTTIPRWTAHPVAGVAELRRILPAELVSSLRALADDLGIPLTPVLLTAHARVLAALSGEGEVTTGYAADSGPPLPLRLTPGRGSWRQALLGTLRAVSELPAGPGISSAGDGRETGMPGNRTTHEPMYETVFDATEGRNSLDPGTVLSIAFMHADGLAMRLRYRRDVLDEESASRIAGYHLTALSLLAADPDAAQAEQSLLGPEEKRFQIEGLAGARKDLPDRRIHELFEEQARSRPDDIAAVHGDKRITYGELNARANRLAHAMIARGLNREAAVGVVTVRDLGWMTAVLAIFKAGGAYLPVEPQFPSIRIAGALSRAGCRLVLTERGSTDMLDRALASLSGVERLFIDAALGEGHPDGNPGIPVSSGQLAYIYFTSGSTGEPKGAMCEHVGMLNHLFAKIGDLGLCAGDVVAQTAPQCFDISLWQLVAALLVGGTTLIVDQETILDAERFLDTIAERGAVVMQVVPSYLEVLVSSLAKRPRNLPDLRFVSVTGEALKKELTERWFAVQPGIRLMNAYGLTETSDDTNHEIMDGVPPDARVPLGRPVNNVRIYVVDAKLSPVPLGAPGEIVFSGICVGRGYVNDPERTERAFLPDPHRPGERLYRSGDFGRWLPDGRLEYLGRRDSQVKISGFRIEIGEIENALLRLPGLRQGAVVVTERPDRGSQLVAFYTGDPADPAAMRGRLGESLPTYMLPSAFHWREELPLTGNGKIDRRGLGALAVELEAAVAGREGPVTVTERRLAAAWAEVLGIPPGLIGRRDHFFDMGGTSLSLVRLAIVLERAVSFRDLAALPVLADQAELIDRRLGPEGWQATTAAVSSDCAASVPGPGERFGGGLR